MTAKVNWTDDMVAVLYDKVGIWSHRAIADYLGLSRPTVESKIINLGLEDNSEDTYDTALSAVSFPMFENVTAEEARRISAGSPKSARFTRRQQYHSEYGSSAAMCLS